MPWAIRKIGGGKYRVVNTESGEVHAKATSKKNAEAQVRLLHGVKYGTKLKGR